MNKFRIINEAINGGDGWYRRTHERTRNLAERIYLYLWANRKHLKWTVKSIGNLYSANCADLEITHPKKGVYRIQIDVNNEYHRMYYSPKGSLIPGECSIGIYRIYPAEKKKRRKKRSSRDSVRFRFFDDETLYRAAIGWLSLSYKTPFLADKTLDDLMKNIDSYISVFSSTIPDWKIYDISYRQEEGKDSIFERTKPAHYRAICQHPVLGKYDFRLQIEDERKTRSDKAVDECRISLSRSYRCEDGIDRIDYAQFDSRDQNLALKWFFAFLKTPVIDRNEKSAGKRHETQFCR